MCVPYWLVYLLHKSLEMRAFFSFREPQITGLAVEVPATNVLAYYGVISGSCEVCMHAHLLQSCLTHCESMECSLPGFSVHRILQARIWSGLPCLPGDLPNPRTEPMSAYLLIIYFWLCWVFGAERGLSLAVESRGYSLAAISGLLVVVASLVVELGLYVRGLSSCGT